MKPNRKLIIYYAIVQETNFTSVKKGQHLVFLMDLKQYDGKTKITNNYFFEIIGFVYVLNGGQIN